MVPWQLWEKTGEAGLFGCSTREECRGAGADDLFDVVVVDEQARTGGHRSRTAKSEAIRD